MKGLEIRFGTEDVPAPFFGKVFDGNFLLPFFKITATTDSFEQKSFSLELGTYDIHPLLDSSVGASY